MPVANYLECGSELKIKVDLAYPLNTDNVSVPTETKQVDEVRWKEIALKCNVLFFRRIPAEKSTTKRTMRCEIL